MGTAYDGPDPESGLKIEDIYKCFCEGALPFVSICCACQMLASYMVLSRGYDMSYVNGGIDCDGNEGLKVFKDGGGKWDKGGALRFADAMRASPKLQPASCYGWITRDAAGTKPLGSHVASVLRVDEAGGKQAQMLDTGAAQDTPRYNGLGVPATRSDTELQAGIDRMKA